MIQQHTWCACSQISQFVPCRTLCKLQKVYNSSLMQCLQSELDIYTNIADVCKNARKGIDDVECCHKNMVAQLPKQLYCLCLSCHTLP